MVIKEHLEDLESWKAELEPLILALASPYQQKLDIILTAPGSDGTYVSDSANYDGTYSTDGNRLRISGILVSDRTFTFNDKN